jgi:hypothetical protein
MVDERISSVEVADEPDDGLKRLMKYVFIAMGIAVAVAFLAVYAFTRWVGM